MDNQLRNMKWIRAISQADVSIVEKMLKEGFNPNECGVAGGNALFDLPWKRNNKKKNVFEIVSMLIKSGIDLNYQTETKNTIIINSAIVKYHPEMIEYFIDAGVDIHHENRLGNNVLTIALAYSNEKLVDKLIEKGMDINHINKEGITYAEVAIKSLQASKELKYRALRHLQRYENHLNQKQLEILDKEKLRLLF